MVVIAVYPAYTSIWGARYWKKPLDRSRRQRGDRHQAAAVVIGRRSQGHSEKRKDGQHPHRPEDRCRKATVQQTANTTGMAHTSGNDQRERPLVGVTTDRPPGTLINGVAQAFKIVRNAGIGTTIYPKRNGEH